MPGRNEPCPCGSGKKYKKCCLPKEKAARAATATNSTPLEQGDGLAFEDEEVKEPRLFPAALEPSPYTDPLIKQFNIFWDAFESSSYEEKWSLVADKLHESPEMFDAETVFEVGNALFSEAAQAGDIDRFNQLLDTFQDRVPDAYAYELGYVLEWRTFGALISGNTAAVEKYFHEFTPIAGQ